MVNEIKYTNIRRVLDNLKDNSLMDDLTLEQVVRHTIRFIGINGQPTLYQDKQANIEIHEYRGLLPCDCIRVEQVMDLKSGICLRSMTDTFSPEKPGPRQKCVDPMNNIHTPYIPPMKEHFQELSFKTNNRVIFTSFPEGEVKVAYKAIPVDDDGFPLLIDDEVYLAALEAYIEVQIFRNKFRTGKTTAAVYQDAKQEYAWRAAQLNSRFTIPSVSEMESIARMWNTMIPKMREFDNGFQHLGSREYLKKH